MPIPDLLEAIDRVPVLRIKRTVYRHIAVGRDCRSGEGARAFGGRWNPPKSFPTLYTAETQETVVAEFISRARTQKLKPADFLPRIICTLDVSLLRVLDLTTEGNLRVVGLDTSALTNTDRTRCQEVGNAAHRLGLEAVLVPSGTGKGRNLVIYTSNLLAESSIHENNSVTWEALGDLLID